MYPLAVGLAVGAALLLAVGAALQSDSAVGVRGRGQGRIGFLRVLITQPRWLLGAVACGCGVAVHVVALSIGPVSAIQPVGTVGLIFAVIVGARLKHVAPSRRAVAGSIAVVAGLAALLVVLPHGAGDNHPSPSGSLGMTFVALGVVTVALLVPRGAMGVNLRAGAMATGAGACFGVAAAFIGVVGRAVSQDIGNIIDWPIVLVIVLLAVGGVAQQSAYRLARFAEVYAIVLLIDPLAAGFTGVVLLGDVIPTTAPRLAWLAVAAAVAAAGVIVLSHDHPSHAREGGSH